MRLKTHIGPQSKKFPMPFGLDGYLVIRRYRHPKASARQYEQAQMAFARRAGQELEAAKMRVAAAFPDKEESELRSSFIAMHDDGYAAFLQEAQDPESNLETAQKAALSMIESWGGPCFEGVAEGGGRSLAEELFGDESRSQLVPRFQLKGGAMIEDPEVFAAAVGVAQKIDAELERKALENEQQKAIDLAAIGVATKGLRGKHAVKAKADKEKARADIVESFEQVDSQDRENAKEDLRTALDDIGVELCPHGRQRLDGAILDVIFEHSKEVEAEFQESLGFLPNA